MSNYIQNNYNMIKIYRALYEKDMNINDIKKKIFDGYFDDIPLVDCYRFRIYLDSCLLLFNKEKVEKEYLSRKFSYKNYIDYLLKDSTKRQIFELCEKAINENTLMNIDIKKSKNFYYRFSSKDDIPEYKQLRILRNSFAHMQYGNFACTEKGVIIYYCIYNKDKGIKKEMGLIVEPIMHYFIEAFFSNNMIKGIPYKHTFVTYDGTSKMDMHVSFWEVRYIESNSHKYEGYGYHVMKDVIFLQNDRTRLMDFLSSHSTELSYKQEAIHPDKLNGFVDLLVKELKRKPERNEFAYIVKAFYDIQTEFSNFLIHLIQLNDRIIDYKLVIESDDRHKINDILVSLEELKEDTCSWLSFKYFFILLECINVMIRLEDDDLSEIKRESICVEGFQYNYMNLVDYVNSAITSSAISEKEARFGDKYYVIERFRNALAHGNIKLGLDCKSNVKVNFIDKWQNRDEKLEIEIGKLRDFLSNNNWSLDK